MELPEPVKPSEEVANLMGEVREFIRTDGAGAVYELLRCIADAMRDTRDTN